MKQPNYDEVVAENKELKRRLEIAERTLALLLVANKIDQKTLETAKELASL